MSKPQYSLTFLMLTLVLSACGGKGTSELSPMEGPGPQLVVERFLAAANANDWQVMGQLFGMPDQTIAERDGPRRSERHMQLLASLLRHDDYAIRGRQQVPGRRDATKVIVEFVRGPAALAVPFMVVRRDDGGWIIQEIQNIDALT